MWFRKSTLERLKKARLTGSITPDEEIKLARMLEASEADREELRHLEGLDADITDSRPEDEQVDVTARVMQTISAHEGKKPGWLPDPSILVNLFTPFPVHYAVLIFIGIVLGSAVTWIALPDSKSVPDALITGSLSGGAMPGMSYHKEYTTFKLVPFRVDNLYYLNFLIDSRDEVEIAVDFDDSEFRLIRSEWVSAPQNRGFSIERGSVVFAGSGNSNFQLIMEKPVDLQSRITVTGRQNQTVVAAKTIIFD